MVLGNFKIGISGLGMVGGAVRRWFYKNKIQTFCYDKFKKIGSLNNLNQANLIFICLPTPYSFKSGYDISAIEENVSYFKTPKIFVIKSTVLPGTTRFLGEKYKIHKFLHNPEFLREKTAYKDFISPDIQIVGYVNKTKNIASDILRILPKASFSKIVPAESSELAKLAINNFLAMKVIFANQIYDLSEKLGIDYNSIKEILENEPRLGKSHFNVWHNNYRGFGGKCLPKEVNSLIFMFKKYKLKPELLEMINKINLKLLKKQNLITKLKKDWLNNKS